MEDEEKNNNNVNRPNIEDQKSSNVDNQDILHLDKPVDKRMDHQKDNIAEANQMKTTQERPHLHDSPNKDLGNKVVHNISTKSKSSSLPEAQQKIIERIALDLVDVIAWAEDFQIKLSLNPIKGRRESRIEQNNVELAPSTDNNLTPLDEDRSLNKKNINEVQMKEEQIKIERDADAKLSEVKNLTENARLAMVNGRYSSAETLLNQALLLTGSNPLLRGSSIEKKINSIKIETVEVQSGYETSTLKSSLSQSIFPTSIEFNLLEQHITAYSGAHYNYDEEYKARINTSRETIKSGSLLNDALLNEYVDYLFNEDNDMRKKHINNLGGAIKSLEQSQKNGTATLMDLEKLKVYKKELINEKLDYKALEGLKAIAKKETGSQDLSTMKNYFKEKLISEKGKEELRQSFNNYKETNFEYKNFGHELVERIKSIRDTVRDKIKFTSHPKKGEINLGNIVTPQTPNAKDQKESTARTPGK